MKDNELSQTGVSGGPLRPGPAKSQRRILVVDDDSGTRKRRLEVLAGSGYDVEAVNDGAAGWDALHPAHHPSPRRPNVGRRRGGRRRDLLLLNP
jgi:CheY-like chemotaxis protein